MIPTFIGEGIPLVAPLHRAVPLMLRSCRRNVELTGTYFHNGSQATMRQVVDFYNRGGDFPDGFTDSQVRPLSLTPAQKDSIVAFLLSLSDDRVRWNRAPFDHPELCVPNGQEGDTQSVVTDAVLSTTLKTIRARLAAFCMMGVSAHHPLTSLP